MNFQVINLETINQSMMGNQEMIKQLVDLYIIQSPTDFQALEDAINNADLSEIRKTAHHIKPTMQYIGAKELLNEFQAIESLAKEQSSLFEINTLFEKIKPKFLLMMEELNSLAKS